MSLDLFINIDFFLPKDDHPITYFGDHFSKDLSLFELYLEIF